MTHFGPLLGRFQGSPDLRSMDLRGPDPGNDTFWTHFGSNSGPSGETPGSQVLGGAPLLGPKASQWGPN